MRALEAVGAHVIVVLSFRSLPRSFLDIVEDNCRKLEEALKALTCSIVAVAVALPFAVVTPNYLAHALLGLIFDPSSLIVAQLDTFVHRQSLASNFPLDQ